LFQKLLDFLFNKDKLLNMKQHVYLVRREDFFVAIAYGQLPLDIVCREAGFIWISVILTEDQAANYKFPIEKIS